MFSIFLWCSEKYGELVKGVGIIPVQITETMRMRAAIEAERREPFIHHHFEVEHVDGNERNIVGFSENLLVANI